MPSRLPQTFYSILRTLLQLIPFPQISCSNCLSVGFSHLPPSSHRTGFLGSNNSYMFCYSIHSKMHILSQHTSHLETRESCCFYFSLKHQITWRCHVITSVDLCRPEWHSQITKKFLLFSWESRSFTGSDSLLASSARPLSSILKPH